MFCKAYENLSHEYDWIFFKNIDVVKGYKVAQNIYDRQNQRKKPSLGVAGPATWLQSSGKLVFC